MLLSTSRNGIVEKPPAMRIVDKHKHKVRRRWAAHFAYCRSQMIPDQIWKSAADVNRSAADNLDAFLK
jgi:hypothetical protein